MQKKTSVAAALLAAGAGLLAAKMWKDNVGGVRDKGERLRMRGEDMWLRGRNRAREYWERGRHRGEEAVEYGRHRGEELAARGRQRRDEMMDRGRLYGEQAWERARRMRGGESSAEHDYDDEYGGYVGPRGQDRFGDERSGKSAARSAETFRSSGYGER